MLTAVKKDDQGDRDELLRGEAQRETADDPDGLEERIGVRGDLGEEDPEELGEGHRDRGDGPGLHDQEHGPAEQEAEHGAIRLAEEDVLPAGSGHHGRDLGAQTAPRIVISPDTAHAASSQPGLPTSRADSAEVMKMPEPIIAPHDDHGGVDRAQFAHEALAPSAGGASTVSVVMAATSRRDVSKD